MNSGLFNSDCLFYLDLQNTNLANIYDLPIKELNREYSCVFTLPEGYHHFLQSNKEDTINKDCLKVVDDPSRLNVIVSESVKNIDAYTFQGTKLTSITIPDSVTAIETYAFSDSALANITFPQNSKLESISDYAFCGTSKLTSVTIPASAKEIKRSAFEGSSLANIIFPENSKLESISDCTFANTYKLTSITIPDSVTTIGTSAFSGSALANIIFSENSKLESISGGAFFSTKFSSITIPASVTTIENGAFSGCSQLANVIFSENSKLESIYSNVFIGLQKLASITIPASVTTIENSAFSGCSQLVNITFSENSKLAIICASAFYNCSQLKLIIIPDSLTTIGGSAFGCCFLLKSVTISDSVAIDYGAFGGCPLETIKINCNTPGSNNIIAILGDLSSKSSCNTATAKALQVALSPSLLDSFADDEALKAYVAGILALVNPTNNALMNTVYNKPEGLFELDLSNTELSLVDVANMTKILPWTVITKYGTQKYEVCPQS